MLHGTLNQLVDALTGLERVLSTPIPVSFVIRDSYYLFDSSHLTQLHLAPLDDHNGLLWNFGRQGCVVCTRS
jgi:hypothetical protein